MAALTTPRLTETFDILTHPHRRYVLYHLTSNSGTADISALAAAIAEWDENGSDSARTSSIDVVETALNHSHLPKLADAGFVTIDRNSGTVELESRDGLDRFLGEAASIDGYAHPSLSTRADSN